MLTERSVWWLDFATSQVGKKTRGTSLCPPLQVVLAAAVADVLEGDDLQLSRRAPMIVFLHATLVGFLLSLFLHLHFRMFDHAGRRHSVTHMRGKINTAGGLASTLVAAHCVGVVAAQFPSAAVLGDEFILPRAIALRNASGNGLGLGLRIVLFVLGEAGRRAKADQNQSQ